MILTAFPKAHRTPRIRRPCRWRWTRQAARQEVPSRVLRRTSIEICGNGTPMPLNEIIWAPGRIRWPHVWILRGGPPARASPPRDTERDLRLSESVRPAGAAAGNDGRDGDLGRPSSGRPHQFDRNALGQSQTRCGASPYDSTSSTTFHTGRYQVDNTHWRAR